MKLGLFFSLGVFVSTISLYLGVLTPLQKSIEQVVKNASKDEENVTYYSEDLVEVSSEKLDDISTDSQVAGETTINKKFATSIPQITATPVPVVQTEISGDHGLLAKINTYRSSNGKNQLSWRDSLCDYINNRKNIVTSGTHGSFTTSGWQSYCPGCSSIGENISMGYSSSDVVLEKWLGSDSHRKNIDGDFSFACVQWFDQTAVFVAAK